MTKAARRTLKTFLDCTIIGFGAAFVYVAISFSLPQTPFENPKMRLEDVRFLRDQGDVAAYYFPHSRWVAQRALPYSPGHSQEYPPLAVLWYSLPRLYANEPEGFTRAFAVQSALCFGLLVGVTAVLLEKAGLSKRRLVLLFFPSVMFFSIWRYDAFPSLFVNASLLAFLSGASILGLFALLAGIFAKAYPAVFLPPFILWYRATHRGKRERDAVRMGLVLALLAAEAIVLAIWWRGALPGLITSVRYHFDRHFELGSLGWVTSDLLARIPALLPHFRTVVKVERGTFAALQLLPVAYFLWRGRPTTFADFVRGGLFLLVPLMTFNGFFSEQYVLWFIPAYLVVARREELLLLGILGVQFYVEFPMLYDLGADTWAFSGSVVLRTVLLVALWVMNCRVMASSGALRRRVEVRGTR